MKEFFSVKEYAALHGMTEQAVYKKIRAGKLQTTERQENGKRKMYILDPTASGEAVPDSDTGAGRQGAGSHPGDAAAADDLQDHHRAGSSPTATEPAARALDPAQNTKTAGNLPPPHDTRSPARPRIAGRGAGDVRARGRGQEVANPPPGAKSFDCLSPMPRVP